MQIYQDLAESTKAFVRKWGVLLLVLANVFVFFLVLSYGISLWQDAKIAFGSTLQIAVFGEGKVSAKPDVAKITATVLTRKELLKDAQDENTKKSNVVVGFLKSSGIAEKDIKTTGYNIYPQYSYPRPCYADGTCTVEQTPRIIGYEVRHSLEVTIRDLEKASDVLTGVVGAGVNEISGLSFTIDEPEVLQAEAREKAIANAKEKADALAKQLGKRVGEIVSFSESGSYPTPLYYAKATADGMGGGPEVAPGENEISVNVSVTYEFK